MLFRKFILLSLSACLAFGFVNPLPASSRSVDNGGTLSAIDAYQDGVGAMIIQNGRGIDNSAMNALVFKYGNVAKSNALTVGDQVLLSGSAEDKLLAGKLFANGTTCNDNNVLSLGETYLNGNCQGGVIPNGTDCNDGNIHTINDIYANNVCSGTSSTLSMVDILGDGSGIALYKLDGNTNDAGGIYNGGTFSGSFISGKFGLGLKDSPSTLPTLPSLNTYTISFWAFDGAVTSGTNRYAMLFNSGGGGTTKQLLFRSMTDSTSLGLALYDFGSGVHSKVTYGMNLYPTDGVVISNVKQTGWYHVLATFDGNNFKFYSNGVLTGKVDNVGSWSMFNGNSNLWVNTTLGESLDQVRIFNKALNQTEVTKLYTEQ